ncbi:hypothetical protein EJ02DRAFT_315747, partial [Clathrospora elynae]
PHGHAHLIDLTSFKPYDFDGEEGYDLKLPDAVATMLFNISKDTMELFLNARVKTFEMIQELNANRSKMKLVIWRQGAQVLLSFQLTWDNIIRCIINFHGTWDMTPATFGQYTRRDLK